MRLSMNWKNTTLTGKALKNNHLQRIELGSSSSFQEELLPMFEALGEHNQSLQVLAVHRMDHPGTGKQSAIQVPPGTLNVLKYIGDRVLPANSTLQDLDISNTHFGDQGNYDNSFPFLWKLVQRMVTLSGFELLSKGLAVNKGLKQLNVSNTYITAKSCKTLLDALKTNATLEVVRMNYNPIGLRGFEYLQQIPEENSTIQMIETSEGNVNAQQPGDSLQGSNKRKTKNKEKGTKKKKESKSPEEDAFSFKIGELWKESPKNVYFIEIGTSQQKVKIGNSFCSCFLSKDTFFFTKVLLKRKMKVCSVKPSASVRRPRRNTIWMTLSSRNTQRPKYGWTVRIGMRAIMIKMMNCFNKQRPFLFRTNLVFPVIHSGLVIAGLMEWQHLKVSTCFGWITRATISRSHGNWNNQNKPTLMCSREKPPNLVASTPLCKYEKLLLLQSKFHESWSDKRNQFWLLPEMTCNSVSAEIRVEDDFCLLWEIRRLSLLLRVVAHVHQNSASSPSALLEVVHKQTVEFASDLPWNPPDAKPEPEPLLPL